MRSEIRHGHARRGQRSRAYSIWCGMRNRCLNPRQPHYPRYGGRGITVCAEWRESFEAFLRDMGDPPPGHSLDRIDNDGPYTKANCVWATSKAQSRRRRSSVIVEHMGKSQTLAEWSEELGVPYGALRWRLKKHGSLAEPEPADVV